MLRTLNTADFIHIPEYSSYNYNYYRNIQTSEIILEIGDDDHGLSFYEASEDEMKKRIRGEYIGFCWMEDFDIPNQYSREHGTAVEQTFEFNSEW